MDVNRQDEAFPDSWTKTLLVRHLPADFSRDEKEDLLKYFGAETVRVFSNKGRLKHAAFATFLNERLAAKALNKLHQLNVLDCTLVVEFAKGQDEITVLKDPPLSESREQVKEEQRTSESKQIKIPLIETDVAPKLGLKFQSNPTLKYLYPPPSNSILANISHALIATPKFYVQVLHLMNKMNLPCPFGPITARPPTYEDFLRASSMPMPPCYPPEYPPVPEEEMEISSEEESEFESGDDDEKERTARLMANQTCKRPVRRKSASKRKKPKIKDLLFAPKGETRSTPVLQPADVFEQLNSAGSKKIEFNIAVSEMAAVVETQAREEAPDTEDAVSGSHLEAAMAECFGKLHPSTQASKQEDQRSDDEDDLITDVISRKELDKGRLSRDEIKRMSVFKNYEAGEPTCRLYVKNIAKQVEEKDLKYIYGRYVNASLQNERNMFDIVLMKEGRMKGQAFVGLPSEQSAEKALRETNGYVLYDKPLVVQFARSAKPKQESTNGKTGGKRR